MDAKELDRIVLRWLTPSPASAARMKELGPLRWIAWRALILGVLFSWVSMLLKLHGTLDYASRLGTEGFHWAYDFPERALAAVFDAGVRGFVIGAMAGAGSALARWRRARDVRAERVDVGTDAAIGAA